MLSIEPIKTGSDGNLYILKSNDIYYLIECGIDKRILLKTLYNKCLYLYNFKGCFVSHKHSDHIESIKVVNEFMPIYSNRQVIEDKNINGVILKPKTKYMFDGELSVMAFNVEHGNAENYAYMFKNGDYKILFITDCFKFDEPLKTKFDEIYIECNWTKDLMLEALERTKDTPEHIKFKRQFQTHLSLDNLKLILENSLDLSNCKKIVLVHASKEVCDINLALKDLKSLYPNIIIEFARNQI